MKFEFEKESIPSGFIKDFGFQDFLERFNLDLPLVSKVILKPLTEESALQLQQEIKKIEAAADSESIKNLIVLTQGLPNPDHLIPALGMGQPESAHLLSLLNFLKAHLELENSEKKLFGLANSEFSILLDILKKFTDPSFSYLLRSQEELTLISKINEFEDQIKDLTIQLEEKILQAIQLKMFYPYPKELSEEISLEQLNLIKGSNLLSLEKTRNGYLANFKLPDEILQIQSDKDDSNRDLNNIMEQKLVQIGTLLKPHFEKFQSNLEKRRHQAFLYALIFAKNTYKLSWPQFISEHFSCSESRHAVLESYKKKDYTPLSINVSFGSTVILGANMSGKTSALRNLYFLTTLCRFGLPVPVKSLKLPFPVETHYHLRTAGRPELNLSSFTEELSFFEKSFKKNSYIFMDELFQSTHPEAAVPLSKFFLEEYLTQKVFFICTTHFLNLVSMRNVQFFKMSDQFKILPFDVLSQKFNLKDEFKKPLELSLQYNIPANVKTKIQSWIKNQHDSKMDKNQDIKTES